MSPAPSRVAPFFREMPWGVTHLEPWFPAQPDRIGEVWFRGEPQPLPILVKFIFTADRLSVQVHPGDEDAQRLEGTPGKTEMWHILRAEPGAHLALGLREPVSRERLRQAVLSGQIESLLNWIAVRPGDTYFIYPGTIHTIGPGVTLCEIQQHRDLTYRLYDYGRGRELHLEKALQVADLNPHPGRTVPEPQAEGRSLLARCRHFAAELWDLSARLIYTPGKSRFHLLVVLEGGGLLGNQPFAAGEVWHIPAGADPFPLAPRSPVRLIRTYLP